MKDQPTTLALSEGLNRGDGSPEQAVDQMRRDILKTGASAFFASLFGGGLMAAASSSTQAQTGVADVLDKGSPYLFRDANGDINVQRKANYLRRIARYRFPPKHRLAGEPWIGGNMETLRRTLIRLFVRCDFDLDAMFEQMDHDIRGLALPFTSRQVSMEDGWVYAERNAHTGFDFVRTPGRQQYPDLTERKDFEVVAVADGTVVGWDGFKLLTLEHRSPSGRLYRTAYNMLRDVSISRDGNGTYQMGAFVQRGQRIGVAYDAPASALSDRRNRKHLHFAMFLSHESSQDWLPPSSDEVLYRLESELGLQMSERERGAIVADLELDELPGQAAAPWQTIEWFPVDPFGIYGRTSRDQTDYGFVAPDLYNPVPKGLMPYAFEDPTGDRIPYFAATDALRADLPVQPVSLGTMVAMLG